MTMQNKPNSQQLGTVDFSKLSGSSSPVLDPVRGDCLPDKDCHEPPLTERKRAEIERFHKVS